MRSDIPRHILMEEFSKAMAYQGIVVDPDDVLKLMDVYMRIIINSFPGVPIDTSHGLNIVIDGTQHADFREMNDGDIENLKNYIRSLNESADNDFYVETLDSILSGKNIIIVLSAIRQLFMFIFGMAKQFLDDTCTSSVPYVFETGSDELTDPVFSITGYKIYDKYQFHIVSDSLYSKMPVEKSTLLV